MSDLPYHHDWKPRFETSHGVQVKWFGRWGEDPDWSIEPSRLASDLICFFYLEDGTCTPVINGVRVPLEPGELVVCLSVQHQVRPPRQHQACLFPRRQGCRDNAPVR